MIKYIKKPIIVEAIHLERDENSIKEAFFFLNPVMRKKSIGFMLRNLKEIQEANGMYISVSGGRMLVSFGDYIIKGVNGEFYPCKPDIFIKTYVPVDTIAEILSFDPDKENISLSMLEKKVGDFYD